MIDLNFSREFFAAMLVTEVEKVGFAVLIRTFPDAMELQHPAVLIRGIREFAFDIAEGCFVRLGARCDGKIEAPATKGKYIKIKYVTQLPTPTPQFAFFVNLPQYIKEPYRRFLENNMRDHWDFSGVPVQIYFRQK